MIKVGIKYNMLTVLEDLGQLKISKRNRRFYRCRCDCGKELNVRIDQIGKIKSCGCIKKTTSAINAINNHKHKLSGTKLYHTWIAIKDRCYNPNNKRYDRYGGRGIQVCEEWINDFMAFYNWAIDNGYDEKLTIDRINNDGNYEPNNCRWETIKAQSRNRSSNVKVNGTCLTEIAEASGLSGSAIRVRYNLGDRGKTLIRKLGEPTDRKKGENNNKAKITNAQARKIKQLLASGEKQVDIAVKFNVSKYLISDIKRGKTWKHILID